MTAIMIISTDDVIIGTNSDGDAELEIIGDILKLLVDSTLLISSLLVGVVSDVLSVKNIVLLVIGTLLANSILNDDVNLTVEEAWIIVVSVLVWSIGTMS
jgi:hypothetical protein